MAHVGNAVFPRLISLGGLIFLVLIAWGMSENRRRIDWRILLWGLGLQFGLGLLLLKTPVHGIVFYVMDKFVKIITDSTLAGVRVVFDGLTDKALFAFQVLPVIIFVTAISAILYHIRVIQVVVRFISWCMRHTLRTSGAETLGAALLIFLGIESMSAIRAYLAKMTRSELCVIMTTFMATIAGSVMVVYARFGASPGHLLTASLMSAPAAILISKLMVPETEEPQTSGKIRVEVPVDTHNVIDAAVKGTSDGLHMALTVGATVIVFIGLVHLFDLIVVFLTGLSFSDIMSYVFRPFAFMLGVSLKDVPEVASLLGTKTVLNEFLAYMELQTLRESGTLSKRSITIATYALCGFANPGSMGIVIAGLIRLVPERREDITKLAVKAFIGGTLACFTTACVAGILVYE